MIIQCLNNLFSGEVKYLENRDVEALEKYIGRNLENGLCIKVDLAELLTVIPRERKRTDAYNTLRRFLKNEFDVELFINSRKGGEDERNN